MVKKQRIDICEAEAETLLFTTNFLKESEVKIEIKVPEPDIDIFYSAQHPYKGEASLLYKAEKKIKQANGIEILVNLIFEQKFNFSYFDEKIIYLAADEQENTVYLIDAQDDPNKPLGEFSHLSVIENTEPGIEMPSISDRPRNALDSLWFFHQTKFTPESIHPQDKARKLIENEFTTFISRNKDILIEIDGRPPIRFTGRPVGVVKTMAKKIHRGELNAQKKFQLTSSGTYILSKAIYKTEASKYIAYLEAVSSDSNDIFAKSNAFAVHESIQDCTSFFGGDFLSQKLYEACSIEYLDVIG